MAQDEIYAIREKGSANNANWKVRVVANKYAALVPEGSSKRREEEGFFRNIGGFGHHEVVIETPCHNKDLALLSEEDVANLLKTYRQRYRDLRVIPGIEAIVIFRNHGAHAGTSLEHPHSQLVALPIVPGEIRMRQETAMHYYDDKGQCVYRDMIAKEVHAAKRVVEHTGQFVVINPYASTVPFETWILPTRHQPCFGNITDEECASFAKVLRRTLRRIYFGLNNPDYNFVIHTAPVADENERYYLWYLQIIPRLTTRAGFEIGSGVYITTAFPEQTAKYLRDVKEES